MEKIFYIVKKLYILMSLALLIVLSIILYTNCELYIKKYINDKTYNEELAKERLGEAYRYANDIAKQRALWFSTASLENEKSRLSNHLKYQKLVNENKLNFLKDHSIQYRKELKNKLILPREEVSVIELEGNKLTAFKDDFNITNSNQIFEAKYYGIKSYGVLNSQPNNECLLIYHQGHGGNPFLFKYSQEILNYFNENKCDVLLLSMAGLGFNEGTISYPARMTPQDESRALLFDKDAARIHTNYKYFYDIAYPKVQSLATMLTGNYYLINHVIKNYNHVSMVGISGGGWYTTMLSALIPEINNSFSFAGSLPMLFRTSVRSQGDWEQQFALIWNDYDYWDFYFLALYDNYGRISRTHYLIYNREDDCCFNDPEATIFSDFVEKSNIHGLNVKLLDKRKHEIDTDFFISLYQQINKRKNKL